MIFGLKFLNRILTLFGVFVYIHLFPISIFFSIHPSFTQAWWTRRWHRFGHVFPFPNIHCENSRNAAHRWYEFSERWPVAHTLDDFDRIEHTIKWINSKIIVHTAKLSIPNEFFFHSVVLLFVVDRGWREKKHANKINFVYRYRFVFHSLTAQPMRRKAGIKSHA